MSIQSAKTRSYKIAYYSPSNITQYNILTTYSKPDSYKYTTHINEQNKNTERGPYC